MIWAGLSGDGVIWLLADKIMSVPESKARSAGVSAFAESTYLTAQIASPRGRMQMLWAMTMLMVSPTSSKNASAFRRWMLAVCRSSIICIAAKQSQTFISCPLISYVDMLVKRQPRDAPLTSSPVRQIPAYVCSQ